MRRDWLRGAWRWLGGLWMLCSCAAVQAQPAQRLVVPFPAGGSMDRVARLLAPELSAATGQSYVVENRPGAEGAIALDGLMRTEGGARALLLGNSFLAAGHVQGRFRMDVTTALKPVIQIGETQVLLVARSDGPWPDVAALLSVLRSGRKNLSCAGPPGQFLQACEWLARRFPQQMVAVPFSGEAQALQALVGQHADVMLTTRTAAHELLRAGRLRLLAASGPVASMGTEAVPALDRVFPGLELHSYTGVFAPVGAFAATEVEQLNRVINQILASERFVQALQEAHIRPVGGAPERLRDTLSRNIQWQREWQSAVR